MRVFNKTKTEELLVYDLSLGYLQQDILTIHVNEQPEIKEKSHLEIIKEYPNGGKEVKRIIDVPHQPHIAEHDKQENILVYIPYSTKELKENKLNELRRKRIRLLEAFDKWEKAVLRERETDSEIIMNWYTQLLDLDEKAFTNIPERITYYL